jgi:hypothetical protein
MKGRKILATMVAIAMLFSAMVLITNVMNIGSITANATPGIDAFEGGDPTVGSDVINTSVDELYYMNSDLTYITANGSANWDPGATYHL